MQKKNKKANGKGVNGERQGADVDEHIALG